MLRQKRSESRIEVNERFRKEAQRRIDSGELNPTDTDAALDAEVRKSIKEHGA